MAPRSRLLDLERDDALFFNGGHHRSDHASVATHTLVLWPIFLAAALLLYIIAPFPHAAAVCAGFCAYYCFLLDRAAGAGLACFLFRVAGGALSPHYRPSAC